MKYIITALSIFTSTVSLNAADIIVDKPSPTNLLDLIIQGGWTMLPLGAVCVITLYLSFYCYNETIRKKFINDKSVPLLEHNLHIRDIYTVDQTLITENTVLSESLRPALSKVSWDKEDCNRKQVESTFIEKLEIQDLHLSSWINYLNVCAAIAPMIGLLGTVSGMIGAFQTIGFQGMGDPSALAGDIGQALITTAAGLCIGIPAMVSFFILRNRLNQRIVETTECANSLIDKMCCSSYSEDQLQYSE